MGLAAINSGRVDSVDTHANFLHRPKVVRTRPAVCAQKPVATYQKIEVVSLVNMMHIMIPCNRTKVSRPEEQSRQTGGILQGFAVGLVEIRVDEHRQERHRNQGEVLSPRQAYGPHIQYRTGRIGRAGTLNVSRLLSPTDRPYFSPLIRSSPRESTIASTLTLS